MFCLSARAQTSVSIHSIMTTTGTYPLPDSPYLYSHYGSEVSVTGVVVGVMSSGDFTGTIYISEPSGDWDSLQATAEGMPIFALQSLNSSCAVVGASVTVVGKIVEANSIVSTAITAANTPGTGMQPTSCTVNSTGNTMTQSISNTSAFSSFGGALEYTGMTTSATFYAVSPTSATLDESSETATSTGQFWATISSNSSSNGHLFRSAGIAGDEYVPSSAPSTVATWSGNPQRVLIDTTTFGGSPVNITVGQSISCTTGSNIKVGATAGIGLIDYTLGYARLLIFPTSVCTVSGSVATSTSAAADSTHFHVGTLDLDRFYSTTGATSGSVAVSSDAYTRRLTKAALAITNSLGKPDIVSLQEVQDQATLQDLASAVNTLASTSYVPYLEQGNDSNSLNVGFLVNSSTVKVDLVTQVEKSATYTTTSSGSGTLWERPPLVLKAEFVRTGINYPVTVVDVHLTPRTNIGDSTLGADVRQHRAAQATDLSALVQSYQTAGENVIVAGNLNAFEFSDGYVDVTGIIDGSPAASSAVTLYEPTSSTGALTDFVTSVDSTSRYNIIENGNAEVLEHILASSTVTNDSTASASLASYVSAVTQPHFTADFAAVNLNGSATPAGLTLHDGLVVSFLIPPAPTTASVSSSSLNFGSVDIGSSVSQTITFTNTTSFTSTVTISGITISGTNSSDYTETNTCSSALASEASCTITVTFAPTAAGARTGALTIASDSTSNPSLTVSLTGIGVSVLSSNVDSLSFGNIDLGATSAAQTVTVSNGTTLPIALSSIAISGSDFSITSNTCGTAIAASSSCAISVVFTPTATGARTGTLSVTSISKGALAVALTGNGVDFSAAFSSSSGSIIAGFYETVNATLTPLGGFSSFVSVSCSTTASGSACTPSVSSLTLSSATTVPITITTTSQKTVIGLSGVGIGGNMSFFVLILSAFLLRRRVHNLPRVLTLLIALGIMQALTGCANQSAANANPTQPGTYTYTLTVTDGVLTRSAVYTLTVTQQ
ncbi:MAG: choice-of-anchor D domain-containing protein [Edaphobacter sp.]|uniref:choice-of-anchor D domain-containing protein n=1 Tax=Edaphobacter sp. TaxID=1934404 RepID=UPI0023A2A073|nr:choice-of-anchor D domain-containing protein [Edaphobacter sp.]MDE1175827.1 choice-of-anchor D domain-containing protein [Edaphobacter sp.]